MEGEFQAHATTLQCKGLGQTPAPSRLPPFYSAAGMSPPRASCIAALCPQCPRPHPRGSHISVTLSCQYPCPSPEPAASVLLSHWHIPPQSQLQHRPTPPEPASPHPRANHIVAPSPPTPRLRAPHPKQALRPRPRRHRRVLAVRRRDLQGGQVREHAAGLRVLLQAGLLLRRQPAGVRG